VLYTELVHIDACMLYAHYDYLAVLGTNPVRNMCLAYCNTGVAVVDAQAIGLTPREKSKVRKALRVMVTDRTTAYISARQQHRSLHLNYSNVTICNIQCRLTC
jgi:hypothetical protein